MATWRMQGKFAHVQMLESYILMEYQEAFLLVSFNCKNINKIFGVCVTKL